MNRSLRKLVLGGIVGAALSGCATLVNSPKQTIELESDPPGATVTIVPGNIVVTTPATATLARRKVYVVHAELKDHVPENVFLERDVSGWLYGNLIFGGLIGITADAGNGSMFVLSPSPVRFELKRSAGPGESVTAPPE